MRRQAPEMVRVPLEELVLQIHLLRLGPAAGFLAKVLEPPPGKSVAGALAQLQAIGALTPAERLTPLGAPAQPWCQGRVGAFVRCAVVLASSSMSHKAPGLLGLSLLGFLAYHAALALLAQ